MCRRKETEIPSGWGLDSKGKVQNFDIELAAISDAAFNVCVSIPFLGFELRRSDNGDSDELQSVAKKINATILNHQNHSGSKTFWASEEINIGFGFFPRKLLIPKTS